VTSGTGVSIDDEVGTYYIPSPLLLLDLNSDKRPEILANRNVSQTTSVLSRIRSFSDGEIRSLIWTGDELLPQWKMRPLRGMVVSQRLADVDNDGQEELVAAAVLEKEGFVKKRISIIYVYELDRMRALGATTAPPPAIKSTF
jgi:hypothetical protein